MHLYGEKKVRVFVILIVNEKEIHLKIYSSFVLPNLHSEVHCSLGSACLVPTGLGTSVWVWCNLPVEKLKRGTFLKGAIFEIYNLHDYLERLQKKFLTHSNKTWHFLPILDPLPHVSFGETGTNPHLYPAWLDIFIFPSTVQAYF